MEGMPRADFIAEGQMKLCCGDLNMTTSEDIFSDFISSCRKNGVHPTRFLLMVSVAGQSVSLFENISPASHLAIDALRLTADDYRLLQTFPCSTSRFGI